MARHEVEEELEMAEVMVIELEADKKALQARIDTLTAVTEQLIERVERDLHEPDKLLCNLQSARRQLEGARPEQVEGDRTYKCPTCNSDDPLVLLGECADRAMRYGEGKRVRLRLVDPSHRPIPEQVEGDRWWIVHDDKHPDSDLVHGPNTGTGGRLVRPEQGDPVS